MRNLFFWQQHCTAQFHRLKSKRRRRRRRKNRVERKKERKKEAWDGTQENNLRKREEKRETLTTIDSSGAEPRESCIGRRSNLLLLLLMVSIRFRLNREREIRESCASRCYAELEASYPPPPSSLLQKSKHTHTQTNRQTDRQTNH